MTSGGAGTSRRCSSQNALSRSEYLCHRRPRTLDGPSRSSSEYMPTRSSSCGIGGKRRPALLASRNAVASIHTALPSQNLSASRHLPNQLVRRSSSMSKAFAYSGISPSSSNARMRSCTNVCSRADRAVSPPFIQRFKTSAVVMGGSSEGSADCPSYPRSSRSGRTPLPWSNRRKNPRDDRDNRTSHADPEAIAASKTNQTALRVARLSVVLLMSGQAVEGGEPLDRARGNGVEEKGSVRKRRGQSVHSSRSWGRSSWRWLAMGGEPGWYPEILPALGQLLLLLPPDSPCARKAPVSDPASRRCFAAAGPPDLPTQLLRDTIRRLFSQSIPQ